MSHDPSALPAVPAADARTGKERDELREIAERVLKGHATTAPDDPNLPKAFGVVAADVAYALARGYLALAAELERVNCIMSATAIEHGMLYRDLTAKIEHLRADAERAGKERDALWLVLKKATMGVNGADATSKLLWRCIEQLTIAAGRFDGIADLDAAIDAARQPDGETP